jgi:hypothetical protein
VPEKKWMGKAQEGLIFFYFEDYLVSVCVFGTENSLRGKILSVKYYYYL